VLKHDEASLTRAAHAVVMGQVVDTQSEWSPGGEFILTYTRVRVDDVAKGTPVSGQTVTVREVGGSVGDYSQEMIGAPTFKQGERVVLFLERAKDRAPGVFQTVALSAGKFLVSIDTASGRLVAVSAAHDLRYAGERPAMWDAGPVDLAELLSTVRRHAAGERRP
jgi:hypothetical protein